MKPRQTSLTPKRALVLLSWRTYQHYGQPLNTHSAQLICYLLQRLGAPLQLSFKPGALGPHSEALTRVISAMRPEFISGAIELGLERPLQIEPLALERARIMYKESPRMSAIYRRFGALIEGMETFYGLWLLCALDWLHQTHPQTPPEQHIQALCRPRHAKIQATPHHAQLAQQRLQQLIYTRTD